MPEKALVVSAIPVVRPAVLAGNPTVLAAMPAPAPRNVKSGDQGQVKTGFPLTRDGYS